MRSLRTSHLLHKQGCLVLMRRGTFWSLLSFLFFGCGLLTQMKQGDGHSRRKEEE
jgi:hypothetical protein